VVAIIRPRLMESAAMDGRFLTHAFMEERTS